MLLQLVYTMARKKPSSFNGYLTDFTNEAVSLTKGGIYLFGKKYNFKIFVFI